MTDKEIASLIGWKRIKHLREHPSLDSLRLTVGRAIELCKRAETAKTNIEKLLKDFIEQDQELRKKYETSS